MGIRQTATIVSNLAASWGMQPTDQATTRWHAEACRMFEGADPAIFGAVVDAIRTGPKRTLDEIQALVRARASRTAEPSENIGYHRAGEKVINPIRISVINDTFRQLRFAGSDSIAMVKLGRSMVARERERENVVDDAEPHILLVMDENDIGPWLSGNLSPTPDHRI